MAAGQAHSVGAPRLDDAIAGLLLIEPGVDAIDSQQLATSADSTAWPASYYYGIPVCMAATNDRPFDSAYDRELCASEERSTRR